MRVLMRVPMLATMEWTSSRGLTGVKIEDTTDNEATFTVWTGPEDEEPIEGRISGVLKKIEALIEGKQFGPPLYNNIANAAELMLGQPIPLIELDAVQLREEHDRVRSTRREWLIEQIEGGSYAAIEKLKEEYGERVKITVQVVEGAA